MRTYKAIAKFQPYSCYKLRTIADVIRGKNAQYALNWLQIYRNKRTEPIDKVLRSALANAIDLKCSANPSDMLISEIKIDNGPTRKYFKPGAQGRSTILRRRFCHIAITVEPKKHIMKGAERGTEG